MESLWNLGRQGFKHLRRKITKIVSHCRASKSQSVGIALQDFHRTVKAHDWSLFRWEIFVNKLALLDPVIDTCQSCLTGPATHELHSLANGGFQNPGVCPQAFPSFPSPPPPPPPLSYFGSPSYFDPNFVRAKHCSGPFLVISVLPNSTETLAMQATNWL